MHDTYLTPAEFRIISGGQTGADLAALQSAASPENGWTAPRRELLARLQRDPSLEVAAPAAWVVPPG